MACTRGVYWLYWAGGYYLDDGVDFFFFSVFTQALYVAWLWRLHVGRYMRISIGYIMESNNDLASPQNPGSVDLVSYAEAHIDQLQS